MDAPIGGADHRPLLPRVVALLRALDGDVGIATVAAATLRALDGSAIPEPQRQLLVHADGLTPTLERHLGQPLGLRMLRVRRQGSVLMREILLVAAGLDHAVSFGAIRLHLDGFEDGVRSEILAGVAPLGTILRDRRVAHQRRLSGFFQVAARALVPAGIALRDETTLYGRHSELHTPTGQEMAEVVEILAPLASAARGESLSRA